MITGCPDRSVSFCPTDARERVGRPAGENGTTIRTGLLG